MSLCRVTTECLEKGAGVEAELIQQLKAVLPSDVAQSIEVPVTPVSVQTAVENEPVVTELPADLNLD